MSFADVVKQVREQPPGPRRSTVGPGLTSGGTFVDPDGVEYTEVGVVAPEAAPELVRAGARVVFDSCGCGSDHGADHALAWSTAADPHLSATSPVLLTRRHGLAELRLWRAGDGREVIQAAGDVEWGR